MPRILFLESAQNFGGARKAVISMAQVLKESYDVEIADIYGSCVPFVDACQASSIKTSILFSGSDPYYIRSSISKLRKYCNLLTFIPHLYNVGKRIAEYVDENNVDWICISGFRPLMAMLFVRPKAKIVFFAHGWYINSQLSWLQKFLLKHLADKIVCISEATKHAIYNNNILPLSKLAVVHNCIDTEIIKQVEPNKIDNEYHLPIIMHCGGFTRGKGQHIAIKVVEELYSRGIACLLIMAGIVYQGRESKEYFDYVKELAAQSPVANNIHFVVNQNNVYGYIRSCDVLIHPSETEGFPLVVMEAQAMRKPVVANSVGGVTDMILHNFTGFLPNHNNVKEYADIIENLLNDKQLYNRIIDNAYNLTRNCFSKEQQYLSLTKIFADNE